MIAGQLQSNRGKIYVQRRFDIFVSSNEIASVCVEANHMIRWLFFFLDKSRIERFMGYASKAGMLRMDMALLVSLPLNVLSGNRSE